VLFITLIVFIYVKIYLNQKLFINILIRFIVRIIIILNRGNSLILILFGWDLLGLTRLLLVLYYNSIQVNRRAYYIILINSLSDSIFIIIIILYNIVNTTQYYRLLLLTITLVAITKTAIWPIHYWLPIAMDAPTPVRCLLHSSTLVVAGYYLYSSIISISNNYFLLWVRLISYLISLNYMWCCEDIKKFIAYSTIINMSIVIVYASRIYREICYIHVVSHRLYKSRLFLIAGYMLMYNSGNQDIRSISIPINIILIIILMLNNLGLIFMFTISTEHLFKILTIPTHIFILPMLTLSIFFMIKITIKLLEVIARNSNCNVLTNKIHRYFYSLFVPLIICLFGDIYIRKLQPFASYEIWFNNIVFIILMFALPISYIHKREINNIAPIRLDQEYNREVYVDIWSKKLRFMRYNAVIL